MSTLSDAIEEAEATSPLPRCLHGSALQDGGGELLEPPCGCIAEKNDAKALSYYQAGLRKQRPEWVPSSVLIAVTVRGDGPCAATKVRPGRHACESNQYGALSVKATNGRTLGIKPDECEPLTWKRNPAFDGEPRTEIKIVEPGLKCPYCQKPVKEDDAAVNGINVKEPPGCTFCDPALAFPTYFVTVTSHEFGTEEFERDSFEEAKQLINEIIANVTDGFTRHFFITGTSIIEDDSLEFESLYARRFTKS